MIGQLLLMENYKSCKDEMKLISCDECKTIIENVTGNRVVRMKLRQVKGKWVVDKIVRINGVPISSITKIKKAA